MTSVERKLDELRQSTLGRDFTGEEFGDVVSYSQVYNNMTFIFASVLNEAQNGPPSQRYRHAETCPICRDVFCPSCLSFHQAQASHPKPATAERERRERRSA
jgi:hypothetical protein